MTKITRRQLARYSADELIKGKSAKVLGRELAAIIAAQDQNMEPEFLLGDIATELERRNELAIGRVSSSHPLDSKVRAALLSQLKKATGAKKLMLEEYTDSKILGGLRVETANRIWDYSLSQQLSELREGLNG